MLEDSDKSRAQLQDYGTALQADTPVSLGNTIDQTQLRSLMKAMRSMG